MCGIFQLMKGVNREPGDPNYDLFQLALKSTALRLYPNYANCDVSMQNDWIAYDRKQKETYINSLSAKELDLLVEKLETNPELKDILMLDVVDGRPVVRQTQVPIEVFSTMGCRTQNGADINASKSYERNVQAVIKGEPLYDNYRSAAQKDGRGNICPVTIILPTIAMETKEYLLDRYPNSWDDLTDEAKLSYFLSQLEIAIYDAKDMLLERYKYICNQNPASAVFMYENNLMSGYHPADGIRSALCHGTLALGQLGLAEALQILLGYDHVDPRGLEAAKKIEKKFNELCAQFKKEYSLNFGVYYTPAESLCHKALKKFREKYGVIPNVSDRDYFTNSMHVPVWHKVSPFEKIDIESQLTGYSNAGCITYVELDGGMQNNIEALEILVNYAMDKDVSYLALNVPNDICLDCGYTGEFNDHCPECGSQNIQQLRRVTGYLTGNYKTAFNWGKQKEVEDRVRHSSLMEH